MNVGIPDMASACYRCGSFPRENAPVSIQAQAFETQIITPTNVCLFLMRIGAHPEERHFGPDDPAIPRPSRGGPPLCEERPERA